VRQRFLLLCEGEVTERQYFEYLRRELRGSLVSIEVSKERGDPLRLVREAIRLRDQANKVAVRLGDDNERFDSVWCVCDVDDHARLGDAVQAAARGQINMAISNPCFELWPVLHFEKKTGHVTAADLRTLLRKRMKEYEKSLDCQKLDGLRQAAISNAIDLDDMHQRNGNSEGSNPSTGVWRLVQKLEKCAGPPILR
jgi:hypothetical protein